MPVDSLPDVGKGNRKGSRNLIDKENRGKHLLLGRWYMRGYALVETSDSGLRFRFHRTHIIRAVAGEGLQAGADFGEGGVEPIEDGAEDRPAGPAPQPAQAERGVDLAEGLHARSDRAVGQDGVHFFVHGGACQAEVVGVERRRGDVDRLDPAVLVVPGDRADLAFAQRAQAVVEHLNAGVGRVGCVGRVGHLGLLSLAWCGGP